MSDLFGLSDDVAVVIGGTGELGGMMAESLGAAGAKVAVLGRNAERTRPIQKIQKAKKTLLAYRSLPQFRNQYKRPWYHRANIREPSSLQIVAADRILQQ